MSISDEIEKLRTSDDDLIEESNLKDGDERGPREDSTETIQGSNRILESLSFRFVPLSMGGEGGKTHVPSRASVSLLDEIGGLDGLVKMTERFYETAFRDFTLHKLLRSKDDPHGRRFGTWIHQKLGGSGNLWDADRRNRPKDPVRLAGGRVVVVDDRTSAHVAAWHSPRRPPPDVGRRFNLDDCRVWMRLHFWAMRHVGLVDLSPSFANYYVRFIGHFINVYEGEAPKFARDSFRWSANQENVEQYLRDGFKMRDVVGISVDAAVDQIREEDRNDYHWPYINSPD